MVEQATAEQAAQNAAELAELCAGRNLLPEYGKAIADIIVSETIPEATEIISRYGNAVTIDEIIEGEGIDPEDNLRGGTLLVRAITVLYAMWVDKLAIINRPDNLLLAAEPAADDWEGKLRSALTSLVVAKGKYMSFHRNQYGWMDWKETEHSKGSIAVVAAFNLKEDFWSEFGNTIDGNSDNQGFVVTVMHEDGVFRHLRYEGELGEIIREVTENPYT